MAVHAKAAQGARVAAPEAALHDGASVVLQHAQCSTLCHRITVQVQGNGSMCFLNTQTGRGHVRILGTGEVDFKGGCGRWAQFVPHFRDGAVLLQSVGNMGKQNATGSNDWFLGGDVHGNVCGTCGPDASACWHVYEDVGPKATLRSAAVLDAVPFVEDARLTPEQKAHFVHHGFVHVPAVVPAEAVANARRVINHQLGQPNPWETNDDGKQVLAGKWQQSPEILALLYHSPAYTLAQRLVGRGKLSRPRQGQIALRSPMLPSASAPTLPGTQWHMDGFDKGKHSPFTLLLGITLSDCLQDFSGNFVVFPGTHSSLREAVQQQVASGSPLFSQEANGGKPDLGRGVQVHARAGDIVMAHQKLAHRGGPNHSSDIRYQVYFRLAHINHAELAVPALQDIWIEYEGLRED